ncbi:MAG: YtxH domain-containing protein [Cyanobacteria bacterium J06641_5]
MANRGAFANGVALGAIAGLAVGLLAAPRTGRENRRTLRKSARALPELAEDLTSSVQLQANRASGHAGRRCVALVQRLRHAVMVGLATAQQELQATADEKTPREAPIAPAVSTVAEFSSPAGTHTHTEQS